MKKSLLSLGMLGVLLIGTLTPAALADGHTAAFCGGLSESDCALLQDATAAANAQPFGMADFEVDLLLTTFRGGEPLDRNITVRGSGAYAFEPALQERAMAIESNPFMLMGTGLAELLADLVAGLDGDLEMDIFLPPHTMARFVTPDENGNFSELPVKLRVVDGMAYIEAETMALLANEGSDDMSPMDSAGMETGYPSDWVGIELDPLLARMMDNTGLARVPEISVPGDLDLLEQFAEIERVDDSVSATGQPLAVFRTVINLDTILRSPFTSRMIASQVQTIMASMNAAAVAAAASNRGVALSEEQVTAAMAMIQQAGGALSEEQANAALAMIRQTGITLSEEQAAAMAMLRRGDAAAAPVSPAAIMSEGQAAAMATNLLGSMLGSANFELSIHESIGLEDGLFHGMSSLLFIDTGNLANSRMATRLHWGIGYRDHGVQTEIVAAEDATIIPLVEAMNDSDGGSNNGNRPLLFRTPGKPGGEVDSDLRIVARRASSLERRAASLTRRARNGLGNLLGNFLTPLASLRSG